jgi:subtilisin-like proprotein convertase family protein
VASYFNVYMVWLLASLVNAAGDAAQGRWRLIIAVHARPGARVC